MIFMFVPGFLSLIWVGVLKVYAMELHRNRKNVLGMSSTAPLLGSLAASGDGRVPWITYLKAPSLWYSILLLSNFKKGDLYSKRVDCNLC